MGGFRAKLYCEIGLSELHNDHELRRFVSLPLRFLFLISCEYPVILDVVNNFWQNEVLFSKHFPSSNTSTGSFVVNI